MYARTIPRTCACMAASFILEEHECMNRRQRARIFGADLPNAILQPALRALAQAYTWVYVCVFVCMQVCKYAIQCA